MSAYKITRLIRSAIWLGEACEVDGLRFERVEPFMSDRLLVSETVRADSYRDASTLFDGHLLPVVDAMTVVTGAAINPGGGSTLIEKVRSKYVYLHAVGRRPSAHLTVVPTYHTDLIERSAKAAAHFMAHASSRHAAYYLRQAALAKNLLTSTFHTLQAAEALGGRSGRMTNRDGLRRVMGNAQYRFFYEPDAVLGENRRNALAHGRLIEEEGLTRMTGELQERLLGSVRDDLGGKAEPSFTPIRGFITFEPIGLFLERVSKLPALPDLVDAASKSQLHTASDPRWVGTSVSRRLFRQW
jgi:hypothetical protein